MTGRCLDARRTKPSYPGRSGVNPGTATGADERYAIWSRVLVYIVSSTFLTAEFPKEIGLCTDIRAKRCHEVHGSWAGVASLAFIEYRKTNLRSCRRIDQQYYCDLNTAVAVRGRQKSMGQKKRTEKKRNVPGEDRTLNLTINSRTR